jgi:hypothetical protein
MRIINTDVEKEAENTDREHSMPTTLTIFIMFMIAGIIIIARGSLIANATESIPVLSVNQLDLDNNIFNETEADILKRLFKVMELTSDQLEQTDNQYTIYFNSLKEYLSSTELYLSDNEVREINTLMGDFKDVLKLEQLSDFNKMSLDGRKIAAYISEQIYKICELRVTFNLHGEIEKIEDLNGYEMYSVQTTPSQGIHIDILVITVLVILLLLCFCIIIAKKNQLFIKDVIYDGINEKGFA